MNDLLSTGTTLGHKQPTVRVLALFLGVVLLALSGLASAQSGEGRGQSRGAPPEALTACEGLSEAQVCSFNGRRGEVSGQCITTPDDQLACAPEGHQSRPER